MRARGPSPPESQKDYAGNFWLTTERRFVSVRGMSSNAPSSWEDYARALGIELQRRRIAADLTQEKLAHRAGITRTHYQQLERGFWKPGAPANPSLKQLARIAQALQIEVGVLLPSVAAIDWPED